MTASLAPRYRCRAVILAGMVLLAPSAWATDDAASGPAAPGSAGRAASFLERLRQSQGITGLSAAVAVDGKIVWSQGFGYADASRALQAEPSTLYRIGSVSKILTTAAVARLIDGGKLDIDADVRRLVPEFPDKGAAITTRHLAGHLSGIRHYRREEINGPGRHYEDVVDALGLFKDDPLVARPGERWSYSSYGWTLISAVVQRASGKSFRDYMRVAVLEPLSLKATFASEIGRDYPGMAALYADGEPVPRDDISFIWAAGGYLSNVEDLVRLGSAFLPGTGFVSEPTLRLLSENQKRSDGEEVVHGIGWMVDRRESGERVLYHGGTIRGGHSILYVEPATRTVVAILSNESSGFGLIEAYIVASHFLGREDPPLFVHEAKSLEIRRKNRENLLAAFDVWEKALTEKDLEGVLSVLSPDLRGGLWPDLATARAALSRWFASGPVRLEGTAEIGVRGTEPGSRADISGLRIVAGEKSEPISLIFTLQVDGSWRIIEVGGPMEKISH